VVAGCSEVGAAVLVEVVGGSLSGEGGQGSFALRPAPLTPHHRL